MRYVEKKAKDIIDSIIHEPASDTDPLGSYTGHPMDKGEKPVQDADDL